MKLNINSLVKIRLTKQGHATHQQHHQKYFGFSNKDYPYKPPEEDEQGYSSWQFWKLMEIFGGENSSLESSNLFETDLLIVNPELIED